MHTEANKIQKNMNEKGTLTTHSLARKYSSRIVVLKLTPISTGKLFTFVASLICDTVHCRCVVKVAKFSHLIATYQSIFVIIVYRFFNIFATILT